MPGIDRFITSHGHLKNVPLGILTNHATLSSTGYPVAFELKRRGYTIRKLFSPEHGVRSQGEDGIRQADELDILTQIPVISLYGENFQPRPADLHDVEAILVDLPNIGCRFYTYWWTITHMIEACALANKKIILLDRPNLRTQKPIASEGPMLDEENCKSFLGRWRMPLTYSLTYGQLLRWFVHERRITLSFEVIPSDETDITELPFIPPSPSMNEWQTTLIYPCTGLFEGINVSVGRGTSSPFRTFGAPWIHAIQLYEAFSGQGFPGITAFPYSFKPMWSHYPSEFCHGLYFYISDPTAFHPVETGIWLLNYLSVRYPGKLVPALYPTAANPGGENHLDLLLGFRDSFKSICTGKEISIGTIRKTFTSTDWAQQVDNFLRGT